MEEGGGDREGSGPLRGRANDGRQGVFSGQPKQAGRGWKRVIRGVVGVKRV